MGCIFVLPAMCASFCGGAVGGLYYLKSLTPGALLAACAALEVAAVALFLMHRMYPGMAMMALLRCCAWGWAIAAAWRLSCDLGSNAIDKL